MLFGWTTEQSLQTPARRFFAVLRQGRQIETRKEFSRLLRLTEVAFCGQSDTKFIKELQKSYIQKIDPKAEIKKKPVLSNQDFAMVLNSMASKVSRGRR